MYADLHRHIDGSLRPATLRELAAAAGTAIPHDLHFFPGMGLDAALQRFAFTLAVLQGPSAVERVVSEICEDALAEGVGTLELRFAPQLHRGATIERVVDAAISGAAGRAGILLCALYGDSPDLVDVLVEVGARRRGVVGIDLAGGPSSAHTWRLVDYAEPFRRAAELGLGRTVHAGEGRPAWEIRQAVEVLGANRIGHGTTLLEDATLPELLISRGVTIEVCLTSNWQVGAIRSLDEHPLPQWLALGVDACVCTDNTLLSDTDAPTEHARAARLPGMTPDLLGLAVACGHAAAFRRS
jgi:adenosine deaminase